MRPTLRRAALALPFATALLAACFEDDIPTRQIGGTEYGLLLSVQTPTRVPTATFTSRIPATTQPTVLDSLFVNLTNLKTLTGNATYRFYAVGTGAGDTVPVAARLFLIHTDSTVSASGTVTATRTVTPLGTSSNFRGIGPADTLQARFPGAQFGGTTRRFLVVTIQADSMAPAFTATTPRPLWLEYRAAAGTNVVTSGSAAFGTFHIRPDSQYRFTAGGRGRSAFWDRYGTGEYLYSAIVENVTQPPLGYYYQPWLRDTRTGRAVRFGELRDTLGASLRDSDLRPIIAGFNQLPVARFRTSEDEIGQPLASFDGVHLVLEPKAGDDTSLVLSTVLVGTYGDTLLTRGVGAVRVTVRRGGADVGGATVVAVPVNGRNAVGSPIPATTADSTQGAATKGQAIISRIPAGLVDLIVSPPTGTGSAQQRVNVIARDTVDVTITLP